jgi:hypothetical protein
MRIAGARNDAAAKSYLFEQVPGLIADKVKQARLVYRGVADNNKACDFR